MFGHVLRRTLLPLLAVVALASAGACGAEGSEKSAGGDGSAKAQTIELTLKDNTFEPKEIAVAAGQSVTFNMKNSGTNMHNLHIVSDDVEPKNAMNTPFEGGKTGQLVVKFPKKGTYKLQCDLHTPDMAGTVTVK